MKVLHIVGFYPEIGGPFSALKDLLVKIHQKGVKVKVISPIPKNYDMKKFDFLDELPYEVVYIKEQLPRSIMPSFSLKFLNVIPKEAKSFDLIYLAGLFDFYVFPVGLCKKPIIYGARGTFMKEAYEIKKFKRLKKDIFMFLIGKKILKKACKIHLITQEEKEDFLEFFPEYETKTTVIPNCINTNKYKLEDENDFREKNPQLKGKKVILFLSRINWKKGLDILIDGFARLYSERKDIHLVIAGKDDGDGYESKVKSWVQDRGLNNAVSFVGLLTGKEKLKAFYGSDVFILPSYSENFGVAIIEALACGIPVITTAKVGIWRELKEYDSAIIIEPTAEGVYKSLKNWLEMGEKAKEMTERGKKMVEELYHIDKVADKMIEMYREVIVEGIY